MRKPTAIGIASLLLGFAALLGAPVVVDAQDGAGGEHAARHQSDDREGRQPTTASLLLVNDAAQHDRSLPLQQSLQKPLTAELLPNTDARAVGLPRTDKRHI